MLTTWKQWRQYLSGHGRSDVASVSNNNKKQAEAAAAACVRQWHNWQGNGTSIFYDTHHHHRQIFLLYPVAMIKKA